MCGIAGYIGFESLTKYKIDQTLSIMKNRGPDHQSASSYSYSDKIINLLHSRLAIIDLDSRSNQPFTYENYHMVFNGEIYNYIEIRNELKKNGYTFKTDSDTEVLIKAYHFWKTNMFQKIEGMWSFAIYDDNTGKLILSRDRFGEKPLYIYKSNNGIYFGSEIKYIKSLSGHTFEVNEKQIYFAESINFHL